MAKLKLGAIADEKPVKLTVELPAAVHRDLLAYANALARETGQSIADPSNWSRRCWHGSWRRTAHLQKLGAKIKSKARDSALSAASGNPLTPDSRCHAASKPNG
jgi:Protein of unknown function (DUF2274)